MRDLTGIPDSDLNSFGGALAYFHFVKITFPSPTGVKRWCNHPAPDADVYNGNIDGSAQDWTANRPMRVIGLGYGRDTALADARVEFANLDDYFTQLKATHGTLRGCAVEIYRAHFTVTLSSTAPPAIGALKKSKRVFKGETDRTSRGGVCGIALKPGRAPWASNFPKGRITKADFPYLSSPDITFNWGDITMDVGSRSQSQWGSWPQSPHEVPSRMGIIAINKPRKTTIVGWR